MKKMINTAFFYAILAMAGGVFYREFTKFNSFTGRTNLGFLHVHLFVLGMFFFLIAALLDKQLKVTKHPKFKWFYGFYNAGLVTTATTLIARGIVQVLGTSLSKAMDASLSGIAGLGHILLGAGIVLYFVMLRRQLEKNT